MHSLPPSNQDDVVANERLLKANKIELSNDDFFTTMQCEKMIDNQARPGKEVADIECTLLTHE